MGRPKTMPDTITFGVRMTPADAKRAAGLAKARGITRNALVAQLLRNVATAEEPIKENLCPTKSTKSEASVSA